MARILDFASGSRLLAAPHNRETWSAVVAAAGRGTRLGFDKPKILFPVAGITILERLIRLFRTALLSNRLRALAGRSARG